MNDFNDKITDPTKDRMYAEDKLIHDMKKNDAEMEGRLDAMNDKANSEDKRPSEVEGRPDQRPYNEGQNPSDVEGRPDKRPYNEGQNPSDVEGRPDNRPYNEGQNPSDVEGRPDQRTYSEVDKTSVGEKHTD